MFQIIRKFVENILRRTYRLTIKQKVNKLKNKDILTVLFILNDLSKWKSEILYIEMLHNDRFRPIIGVTIRRGESVSSYSQKVITLVEYLNKKDYEYIELDKTLKPNPDIIIYTEPYGEAVPIRQSIFAYWKSLFVSINYCCHITHLNIDYFTRLHECAWIDCYESKAAAKDAFVFIGKSRNNIKLTGLPMFDQLAMPSDVDPWKKQEKRKKRIIWAPHHSLGKSTAETIVYGNFLEYYQFMLDIAIEYEDIVQFAFKPHPLLKEKLFSVWGIKKTNEYFSLWDNLSNGQTELGAYQDLFKNSDALIHDCSTFMVEYQFLNKPILFIVRNEENILKDMNSFGKHAFYSQTLGYTKQDVKEFIDLIINDLDNKMSERKNFLEKDIIYDKNISASKRIIDSILSSIR